MGRTEADLEKCGRAFWLRRDVAASIFNQVDPSYSQNDVKNNYH